MYEYAGGGAAVQHLVVGVGVQSSQLRSAGSLHLQESHMWPAKARGGNHFG